MRSRDALKSPRAAPVYAAALRFWTQREWGVGNKKPIETGYTAIAKMAYEILVWVLILLHMILDHPAAL